MVDLIDRQALVEDFRHCGASTATIEAVVYRINLHTAVDAVQVTRCKDCKWYKDLGTNYRLMDCSHEKGLEDANETDFCSYGERREDDERD